MFWLAVVGARHPRPPARHRERAPTADIFRVHVRSCPLSSSPRTQRAAGQSLGAAAMAQASAPDDSDDELQLLAALERDLEAVSLSDGELEGEEQEIELPEVVPLGSVEELLAAADAGAGLLNDVRAFQREGALAAAVKTALPIAIMHMQGQPKTMQLQPEYRNVIDEVREFLQQRVEACIAVGIAAAKIILDPGFGFGKSLEHNLELLSGLAQLRVMDMPLLVGMSRKSMIGALLNNETDERLYGGLALASLALERGANIIRTHDVGPTKDVVDIFYALSQRAKG